MREMWGAEPHLVVTDAVGALQGRMGVEEEVPIVGVAHALRVGVRVKVSQNMQGGTLP